MVDGSVQITAGSGTPIRVLTGLGAGAADQQVITLGDSAGNLLGTAGTPFPVAGSLQLVDGTTSTQKAKVDAAGGLSTVPQAVQLTGSSTAYGTTMTVSLGVLTLVAGGSLPDYGSVEIHILNQTNQATTPNPALTFTGDAIGTQTPVLSGIYQPYAAGVAAGSTGVQKIALNGGILRNVSVSVPMAVAPTTGTLYVLAVFHPQRQGLYVTDPSNGLGLRMYSEGSAYSSGNVNLLVMGREYGAGGADYARALQTTDMGAVGIAHGAHTKGTATGNRNWVRSSTAAAITSSASLVAAPVAGLSVYVTDLQISNAGATGALVSLTQGTAIAVGTNASVLVDAYAPVGGSAPHVAMATPMKLAAATALGWLCSAASTTVYVSVAYFIAP